MSTESTITPKLLDLPAMAGWKVEHHRLFDLDPTLPDILQVDLPPGFTVWDLYFGQDLLLLEHTLQPRLIDVGWYPHADPEGSFRTRLIGGEDALGADKRYNWNSPVVEYRTRSIRELQSQVVRLMQADDE
ncbi:MAG: hypothetical protein LC104_04750 [Bacteroidales bacterium]|nr:hypothetical protein [Bacteroidales bacterium]